MEIPLPNMLLSVEDDSKYQILGAFFFWSTECVQEIDFEQLIIKKPAKSGLSTDYDTTTLSRVKSETVSNIFA